MINGGFQRVQNLSSPCSLNSPIPRAFHFIVISLPLQRQVRDHEVVSVYKAQGPIAVPTTSQKSCHLGAKPRILIIGAGYRGHSYAEPIHSSGEGIIAAVAEPSEFKRRAFGERFIWGTGKPLEGQAFSS